MTNWPEYNEKLVNEAVDVFVSTDLLVDQEKQLKRMNRDKRGRPYSYSDALILLILAVREYFSLPYRQTEGFARMLGGIWGAMIPSYTQICRRQKELNVPLGVKYDKDKPVDIAIDSTGIKAFNRGEWIRQKWAVRRGWVKLHITCDISNHLITSVQVTDEHESDGKEFGKLVDGAKDTVGKVSRVFGDSAYDSRAIFNYAAGVGPEPVIKPRMNSTGRSRGSYVRAQTVREFLSDPQAWKEKHRYGQRWQVETVFSSLKRMLGEYFTSVLNIGIYNEIMSKVFTYNIVEANRNACKL
jgi:hypothetical protein